MIDVDSIWVQSGFFGTSEPSQTFHGNYYLCPCGGTKVFPSNDLPACSSCGKMDTEYLSEEPEWISGVDNDGNVRDSSRCGGPVDEDFYSANWSIGTKISSKCGGERISRIHFHMSMNHKDRSLFHAYADIEKVSREKLGCNDMIIDDAKILYRELCSKKLTRGDVRKGIKANCVLIACKKHGYPRTTKEIAEAFELDTRDIGRTSNILNENVNNNEHRRITMPKDIVVRIFENIDQEINDKSKKIRQCVKICERIERNVKLMGKTPSGVASAVVYIVIGECVPKQSICDSASISMPTLNKIEILVRDVIRSLE